MNKNQYEANFFRIVKPFKFDQSWTVAFSPVLPLMEDALISYRMDVWGEQHFQGFS